jgi:hypothetical protein
MPNGHNPVRGRVLKRGAGRRILVTDRTKRSSTAKLDPGKEIVMKLALATFAAALIAASSASAMVTQYDHDINQRATSGELMNGQQKTVDVSEQPAGPSSEWRANGVKTVTVFDTGAQGSAGASYQGR